MFPREHFGFIRLSISEIPLPHPRIICLTPCFLDHFSYGLKEGGGEGSLESWNLHHGAQSQTPFSTCCPAKLTILVKWSPRVPILEHCMETYILWPLSFVFGKVQTYFLCFSVGCWLCLSTFFIPVGAPFATYSTPINLTCTLETQPISYCLAEVKCPLVCLLLLFYRYLISN